MLLILIGIDNSAIPDIVIISFNYVQYECDLKKNTLYVGVFAKLDTM